jgi:dihydroorotase
MNPSNLRRGFLQRPYLRTFKHGSVGDASILEMRRGTFALDDVKGEVLTASKRLFAAGTVLAGRWWHTA